MTAPGYEWRCQKCAAANAAGESVCAACGFSAAFTSHQLREGKAEGLTHNRFLVEMVFGVIVSGVALICGRILPGSNSFWVGLRLVFALVFFAGIWIPGVLYRIYRKIAGRE